MQDNSNNNHVKAKGSETEKDPGNRILGDLTLSRNGVTCKGYQHWAAWADLLKKKQKEKWKWVHNPETRIYYITLMHSSLNPKRK